MSYRLYIFDMTGYMIFGSIKNAVFMKNCIFYFILYYNKLK